jgi:hypothetical protein
MLGIGAGDFVGVPSSEHGEIGTGLRGANDDDEAIFTDVCKKTGGNGGLNASKPDKKWQSWLSLSWWNHYEMRMR